MKKCKNWLLPIFTCLVVLCAALLPQRLSELRDRALLGAVHTEELTDNRLPARPLSLAERIELLSLWSIEQENFTVVTQELSPKMTPEEMPALQTQVWEELKSLVEAGVLSEEMLPEDLSRLSGERTSVRLSEDLQGATVLQLGVVDKWKGPDLSIILDADTGHAIALQVFSPISEPLAATATDIGKAFMDRLGIENQVQTPGADHAVILLPETKVLYDIDLDYSDGEGGYCFLTIQPDDPPSPAADNLAETYDAAG